METIEELQSRSTALISQIDEIERVFRKVIDDPIEDEADWEAAFEILFLASVMRYVADGVLLFDQVPNYPVFLDAIAGSIDQMEQEVATLIHDLEEASLWPFEAWDTPYHPLQWRAYKTGQRLVVIALACLGLKDNPTLPDEDRHRYAEIETWAKNARKDVQKVLNTHLTSQKLEDVAAVYVSRLEAETNEVEDNLLVEGYLEATENGTRLSELILERHQENWTNGRTQ